MANEAVKIENGVYPCRRYTVADGNSITKGALLVLTDPNTASGSTVTTGGTTGNAFAGIAAMDKVANDGSTEISAYVDGIFDLTSAAGLGISCGALVMISGTNLITALDGTGIARISGGAIVGKALETASASEVIRVAVGRCC